MTLISFLTIEYTLSEAIEPEKWVNFPRLSAPKKCPEVLQGIIYPWKSDGNIFKCQQTHQ